MLPMFFSFQLVAGEGLDGQRHGLQRLRAGLLRRDDDFVELREFRRLGACRLQAQCGRDCRGHSQASVMSHKFPPNCCWMRSPRRYADSLAGWPAGSVYANDCIGQRGRVGKNHADARRAARSG